MTAKTLPSFAAALALCAMPVMAQGFTAVTQKNEFVELVNGKKLTRFGITLDVTDAGRIEGRAFGRKVTGAWEWSEGFFCRVIFWGSYEIGQNCQEVRVNGNTLRFTSDQGAGDFADLRLK